MNDGTHYDAVVVGGGMAGLPLALKLGFKKFKVALVERDRLGGTCLNRGCIPTKTMIASAKVAHHARHAERWGVLAGEVRVNLGRVVDRKDDLVNGIRSNSEATVRRNEHLTLVQGEARFSGERTLTVNGRTLTADRVFVNTGTRNAIPRIEGLDRVPFLDSTSALDLRELPEHLVVVGGGYIGVEYAQMYRRFGSRVTLVQRGAQLLAGEDEDIATALQGALEDDGINVILDATARAVRGGPGRVTLTVEVAGGARVVEGSHLMIAAGRRPNTDGLALDLAGVETDARGFVKVNDRLETTAPGVWALGDLRGGPMFTHTARDDARVVYENVTRDAGLSIAGRVVPWAVFSDPQLGRVGLNEREARAAGLKLKVGTYEGRKVAKARANGEPKGLIKVVADAETDKLLGAAVLLEQGAEVVHEMVAAIKLGARYTDLTDMIHVHPTLAEGLSGALGGVHYEEGI